MKLLFLLGVKPEELEVQISEGRKAIENMVKYNKMNADSIRQYVVGDNVYNINERYYGCNRVQGPDALHGTHVSGIIAAIRNFRSRMIIGGCLRNEYNLKIGERERDREK